MCDNLVRYLFIMNAPDNVGDHTVSEIERRARNEARRRARQRYINVGLTVALIILKATAFLIIPTVLLDDDNENE